jgi:hypothetical protein
MSDATPRTKSTSAGSTGACPGEPREPSAIPTSTIPGADSISRAPARPSAGRVAEEVSWSEIDTRVRTVTPVIGTGRRRSAKSTVSSPPDTTAISSSRRSWPR